MMPFFQTLEKKLQKILRKNAFQLRKEKKLKNSKSKNGYNLHLMAGRLAPASEVAGGHTLLF
jgi:hypothetical protein